MTFEAKPFRQLAHGPDVTLLRAFGQASKLQTLDHSLSQFSHGYTSRLETVVRIATLPLHG
jgi:hypothetical protein